MPIVAARRGDDAGARARAADQSVLRSRALARRPEGRVRRARRRLRRVGARRRRRGARDDARRSSNRSRSGRPTAGGSPTSRRAALASRSTCTTSTTNTETALTTGTRRRICRRCFRPTASRIAFLRNRRELRVLDLEIERRSRVLATGTFADTIDSPSRSGRPTAGGSRSSRSARRRSPTSQLVPLAGGGRRGRSVSSRTSSRTRSPGAATGRTCSSTRGQRTEHGQLARVDLTLRTPKFREDLFRDLFSRAAPTRADEPAPTAPAPGTHRANPATPEPRNPRRPSGTSDTRLRRHPPAACPSSRSASTSTTSSISPDGKTAVVIAADGGPDRISTRTRSTSWRPSGPVARQLTTTPGGKSNPQFTPDSREVYFLDAGRIQIVDRRAARSRGRSTSRPSSRSTSRPRSSRCFSRPGRCCATTSSIAKFNGVELGGVARDATASASPRRARPTKCAG